MIAEQHFYELEGLRESGDAYTYEVLGEQTEQEARRLAKHYADLWTANVNLYRVPFLNLTSHRCAAHEKQFICLVNPERVRPPATESITDDLKYNPHMWIRNNGAEPFEEVCHLCGVFSGARGNGIEPDAAQRACPEPWPDWPDLTDEEMTAMLDEAGSMIEANPIKPGSGITRPERLRRVVLLCSSFARNLAYYRTWHNTLHPLIQRLPSQQIGFWIEVQSNALDMIVLDWCKLFGDHKGEHYWKKVVSDPVVFEAGLLAQLAMTDSEFKRELEQIRRYRDKFVAHLDSDRVMAIPFLDMAQKSVWFYHEYLVTHEAANGELAGLADTARLLAQGYADCTEAAEAVYRHALAK